MPRPRMPRRLGWSPRIFYFKPQGVPLHALEEVVLTKDEVEALRLVELNDLSQEQAAIKMNVSQPTLYRILKSARRKISDAIINGKAIRIE